MDEKNRSREPCPPGTDPIKWSEKQNEFDKEWRNAAKEREQFNRIFVPAVVVLFGCFLVVFGFRETPEPVGDDVKALAAQMKVLAPTREPSAWPTIDKETRSVARATLFTGVGTMLGFLLRGKGDKKKPED